MKEKILAIVGPTGSGKSALALRLCQRLGGELISCDSMQIYRRMDVGTAKPTKEEQRLVPHHMIDLLEPTEPFSCADYVSRASEVIGSCHQRGVLPVICGGTGLYLDALLRGEDLPKNTTDQQLRRELWKRLEEEGCEDLWETLKQVDPAEAEKVHPHNVKRVIRALEIYYAGGIPKSEQDRRSQSGELRYDATVIGLRYVPRECLYEQIERRVDQMLAQGLAEETGRLKEEGVFERNGTAAGAIGYKELLPYLNGQETLVKASERLKTATRRYAKRQMTWFGAKAYVQWIDIMEKERKKTFEEIVNNALELFQKDAECDKIKGENQ